MFSEPLEYERLHGKAEIHLSGQFFSGEFKGLFENNSRPDQFQDGCGTDHVHRVLPGRRGAQEM